MFQFFTMFFTSNILYKIVWSHQSLVFSVLKLYFLQILRCLSRIFISFIQCGQEIFDLCVFSCCFSRVFSEKHLSQIVHANLFVEWTFDVCSLNDCNLVNFFGHMSHEKSPVSWVFYVWKIFFFGFGNKTTHITNVHVVHYQWYDLLNNSKEML